MRIGNWEIEWWEIVPGVWCGLLGVLWAVIAHWVGLSWELSFPQLDPTGVASAVLLGPFWATWIVVELLARPSPATPVWFVLFLLLPETFGLLAGLLAGILLTRE